MSWFFCWQRKSNHTLAALRVIVLAGGQFSKIISLQEIMTIIICYKWFFLLNISFIPLQLVSWLSFGRSMQNPRDAIAAVPRWPWWQQALRRAPRGPVLPCVARLSRFSEHVGTSANSWWVLEQWMNQWWLAKWWIWLVIWLTLWLFSPVFINFRWVDEYFSVWGWNRQPVNGYGCGCNSWFPVNN